jgi:ectoine hydroxylase-related dioxygenase (phytanoyl-CoA dioxygenase family)
MLTGTHLAAPTLPWTGHAEDCRVEDLASIVETGDGDTAPSAIEWANGVPCYEAAGLTAKPMIEHELAAVLLDGPGVLVARGCIDPRAVDRATTVFGRLIDEQRRAGAAAGDHFAEAGANDRIWNSLEKLALAAPEVFVDYYASSALALVCRSWLGPGYQITAQVNVVNPGGEAQRPHRDYHLGFMTEAEAERFPRHAHLLSPVLTLQAGIAHGPVSLPSGPTKLLPHSQKYAAGYLAWRRPEFIDYFEQHCVQLEMGIGDAVFFNPALFHAAGSNQTDRPRMVNLLQVGSAMGRTMEQVDRRAVALAAYPALLAGDRSETERAAVVAAAAEGYPFPADLDRQQPEGRLTPETAAAIMTKALEDRWTVDQLAAHLP